MIYLSIESIILKHTMLRAICINPALSRICPVYVDQPNFMLPHLQFFGDFFNEKRDGLEIFLVVYISMQIGYKPCAAMVIAGF